MRVEWMQPRILFFLVFLMLPLPLFGLEGLMVPAARFLQLATALSILVVIEGSGGMVGSLLLLLWIHALFYGAMIYWGSRVVTRRLLPKFPELVGPWLIASVGVGLACWGLFGEPYASSFHHSEAHASLTRLYR
jgi:hypothetical protein